MRWRNAIWRRSSLLIEVPRTVWRHSRDLSRAALLPYLGFVLLYTFNGPIYGLASTLMPETALGAGRFFFNTGFSIVWSGILLTLTTMFAVAWTRALLLPDEPATVLSTFRWRRRHGETLWPALWIVLLMACLSTLVWRMSHQLQAFHPVLGFGFFHRLPDTFAYASAAGTFGLALTGAAIGRRLTFAAAWRCLAGARMKAAGAVLWYVALAKLVGWHALQAEFLLLGSLPEPLLPMRYAMRVALFPLATFVEITVLLTVLAIVWRRMAPEESGTITDSEAIPVRVLDGHAQRALNG